MNYIQENCEDIPWYTSLKDVIAWLEIDAKDYDWHFSDVEGGWAGIDDPSWVTGGDLVKELEEFDYQFDWSVISVFPKGTKPFISDKPFADGNPESWRGIPKKQLNDSIFEIVCWDSSATLFIDLPDYLGKRLLANAPGIKDLNKENRQRQC